MADKRRLNLSFSLDSPQQRQAWHILRSIPPGQRTGAVCRMICAYQEREELLDAVRTAIREELGRMDLSIKTTEKSDQGAGDEDESVLGFLRSLDTRTC
jgi:hypothetical protein